jgi:hypothetical protein
MLGDVDGEPSLAHFPRLTPGILGPIAAQDLVRFQAAVGGKTTNNSVGGNTTNNNVGGNTTNNNVNVEQQFLH